MSNMAVPSAASGAKTGRIRKNGGQASAIAERENPALITAHLNPLPRSVRRDAEYLLLDGEWRFELDPHDHGLLESWYLGHQYSGTIRWPSSIEAAMGSAAQAMKDGALQGNGSAQDIHLDSLVGWYEREFSVPEAWRNDPGCIVQVTFGACGFETMVWLNGHPLHTVDGEEVHLGEYTSFSYELPSDLLRPPGEPNRLTVRTADTLDAEIPRGKQESRVYKRGGIWYQTISGPVRSIWIEPVMRNRLRSRLVVSGAVEDGLADFELTTRVHDEGEYTLRLVVTPRRSEEVLARKEVRLRLRPGNRKQHVVVEIPGAKVWSPENPHLYTLRAELEDAAGVVSRLDSNFGLRKIEARGRWVYLNNKKFYLDGILYQPGTSTFEQMASHFHAIKALGCNLVRVHIAGVDPRIYDLADQIGLLLWVEVPSPHTSSQRSRDHHWAELQRMLAVVASHASVVILSLYNEDWGVEDIAFNALTREYIARTYAYLRVNYPQLLVVDNDGWKHVSSEGRLQSDLLTAHIYTTDQAHWENKLDRLSAGDMDCLSNEEWQQPLVVGDHFFYEGQEPLIVSEWGGFGWSGYGGPQDSKTKGEQIRAYKRELRKRPIAGDVYTQATSIEGEVNGIIDPNTCELLVPPGALSSRG
jgi:hypothetical protein